MAMMKLVTMKRPSSNRLLSLVLCAVLASWSVGLKAQDADVDYRRGIQAADGGDWRVVAEMMASAIAVRPDPGGARVKIYGMRYEPYTPYYWLGLAHGELDDCAAAVEAWNQSVAGGALADARLDELNWRSSDCSRSDSPAAADHVDRSSEPELAPTVDEPPPPAWLLDVANKYLDGRYQRVIDQLDSQLDGLAVTDERQRATALMLRSAARFSLARVRGARGGELLGQARDDARASRRLSSIEPSPYWFSPAFVAFWNAQAG